MERLTEHRGKGTIIVDMGKHHESAIRRLAAIEDILGDEYDLERLRELVEACKGLEPKEIEESKLLIATRKDPEKIARVAEAEPDVVQVLTFNKDGSVFAHVPKNYIAVRKPKQLSEEQRAAAGERLRKWRGEK